MRFFLDMDCLITPEARAVALFHELVHVEHRALFDEPTFLS
jgi:hypothetical protein